MTETAPMTSARINETFAQVDGARAALRSLEEIRAGAAYIANGARYLEIAGISNRQHDKAQALMQYKEETTTKEFGSLATSALSTMMAKGSPFRDIVKVSESSEDERRALFDTLMVDGEAVEIVTTKSMSRFVDTQKDLKPYNHQAVKTLFEFKRDRKDRLVRQRYEWGFLASDFTTIMDEKTARNDEFFHNRPKDELLKRYRTAIAGVLRESMPYRETVEFSLDGADYAAEDLRPDDAQRLREAFGGWTKYARQTGSDVSENV